LLARRDRIASKQAGLLSWGREEKLEHEQRLALGKRLRLILLLMATWDLLGAVVQLYTDSFAFRIDGQLNGFLAARALSGALVVPAVVYLYALRDPLRHRAVLWLAVIEQLVAICTTDDFGLGNMVVPLAVAVAFLILVLLNYPRGEEEKAVPEGTGPDP
jgi:hypothetical protein